MLKSVLPWAGFALLPLLPAAALVVQEFPLSHAFALWLVFFIPLGALRWLHFLPSSSSRSRVPVELARQYDALERSARRAMRSRVAIVFALPLVPLALWVNALNLLGRSPLPRDNPTPIRYSDQRDDVREGLVAMGIAIAVESAVILALLPQARRQRRLLAEFISQSERRPSATSTSSA
ncbi:MAG: hypothetical protein JNM94_01425 [Phycisphaerae bacterium]|nr:hypothetical protein [Phycisphaerae bacterium]